MTVRSSHFESRVLIMPPTAKDGEVTSVLLGKVGLECTVCRTVAEVVKELRLGAGLLVLTDLALNCGEAPQLTAALEQQPSWSDIPVIMMMRGALDSDVALDVLRQMPNVLLLERPASMRSLLSAAQGGMRARMRQYQMRDQVVQLASAADERLHLMESERTARSEAERASRMKDEFVATLSHELRTPMTSVLGWVQLLRRSPDDRAIVNQGLEVIERNAKLQSQLVDDLLDMSRILSGKVRLKMAPVELEDVIRSSIQAIQHSAHDKNLEIETELAPLGTSLADADRIQQVLWNLLSNAVKFTQRGGKIGVRARRLQRSIEISVTDSGVGISSEFLPYIFERFRQSEPTTTRKYGGLGLGLSIVKSLLELHGGSVTVYSDGMNKGSTFTVRLPIEPSLKEDDDIPSQHTGYGERTARANLSGVRVLVIDDDRDVLVFLVRLLEECNAKVTSCSSAQQALRLVSEQTFDVIVSDIGMPDMDGYEFMRRLRAEIASADVLPAIALTAFAGEHHQERALRAGYQAHITKPVNLSEFFEQLGRLTASQSTAPATQLQVQSRFSQT